MLSSSKRQRVLPLLSNSWNSIGEHSGHTNVAAWEVLSGHVHQIFKDGQGDALGHVDDGSPGRIPAAADAPGPCAVETRITRPAYAENATAGQDGHQEGMLCSMRVSVRSTSSMPSLVANSSVGVWLSNRARGVDSQCVAFCSSPNTATACAMTGTRRVRGSAEVIRSLFYLGDGFLKTSAILPPAPVQLKARRRWHSPETACPPGCTCVGSRASGSADCPPGREKSTTRGTGQQGHVWDERTLLGNALQRRPCLT